MNIYLITLTGQSDDAWKHLAKEWPGEYCVITGTLAMVAPSDQALAPESIGQRIGIMADQELASGMIVRLDDQSDYWGRLPVAAAKWLSAKQQQQHEHIAA